MMLRRVLVATMVALSCLLIAPQAAEAKPNWNIKDSSVHESRSNKLDIVGHVQMLGSFNTGVGVWYSIPVVPDGFIPVLNDSFVIEFGGFLTYWDDLTYGCDDNYFRISPLGGVRWDFMLTPEWTVFAVSKVGYHISTGRSVDCAPGYTGARAQRNGLTGEGGVGAYWNFSDGMGMRLEAGPFGVNAGISIDM